MTNQKRWPVYISGRHPKDKDTRTWVPIFFDPEYARLLIENLVGDKEHRFEDDRIIIQYDFEITVRCAGLAKILETPLTGLDLDQQSKMYAVRFKYAPWEERWSKPQEEEEVETTNEDGNAVVEKKPKPQKAGKPEGFVTITELCKEWDIKPLHARQALRVSNIEKPEYGWAFDPKRKAELKKICGVK